MAILIKIIPALILLGAICIASGTDMPDIAYQVSGSDSASSADLSQYQEYYSFDQGSQAQAGPIQYMVSGSEPESLMVSGQSRPYDPSYISLNSFWIQGARSWTQYIKCPMYASFRMLAFSNGGPTTVVERYPDGYEMVNRYNFYPGYTRLIFEADAVGRHILSFYSSGQVSNEVIVDVVPYGGLSYGGSYPGASGYSSGARSSQVVIHTGGKYDSYQSQYDQSQFGWNSEPGYDGVDQQIVVKETYI